MPTFEFTSPDGKSYEIDGPQGATKEQAFAMLQSHLGQAQEKPNALVDAARSIPGGLAKGITGVAGLPGTLSDLASSGLDYLANKVTGADVHTSHNPLSGAMFDKAISAPTGGFYEPKTTLGNYAQTAASFAPAAFGGAASLAGRALGRVLAPAVTSETAGQATKGTSLEPFARFGGAILGGSPAGIAAGARAIGERLMPRLAEALPAEDAALVRQYEQMGGHLRPGQYAPSNFMRQGDAVLSDTSWPRLSGFAANSEHAVLPAQQSEEFNRMLGQTFGEDAPRLTGEVATRAGERIGNVFNTVLPRNRIVSDPGITNSLGTIEQNVAHAAPAMKSGDVVRIQNVLEAVRRQLHEGEMPGSLYQSWRERGGILDELAGSNSPVLQRAGQNLRNTLDDAFARQATGEDAAALTQARSQYRNLQTLMPLIEKAPTGNISPGLVMNRVTSEFGLPENAGDLGTLARVGSAFLKAQPSSGTAERNIWRSLVNKPFSEGIPTVANSAVSLPISGIASRQLNRVINSPEMRQRLLANALQNQAPNQVPNNAAQLGSLLTGTP